MKNLLIITALLLPVFCQAQVSADFGMGASFYSGIKASNKINYAFNIGANYNLHNVVFSGDLYGIVTRNYGQPKMLVGASVGYQIINFTPSIGYYSLFASSDDKSLNTHSVGYSLEYYKEVHVDRGIFIKGFYAENTSLAVLGFRANF